MEHYLLKPLSDSSHVVVVLQYNNIDCMDEGYNEEDELKSGAPIEIGRLECCDLSIRIGETQQFYCLNDMISGGKYEGLFCGDDFLHFLRKYENALQRYISDGASQKNNEE
jgi:hypothetical protein